MEKQRKRRWMSMLLGLLLCLSLAACGNREETQEAPEETSATPIGTEITCYADFSNGSETAEEDGLIKTEKRTVTEVNPDTLAEELSDWSGWDFTLKSYTVEDKTITVDWAETSTLLAGMGEDTGNGDFTFEDSDALCWFMMDSLYQTLMENMAIDEVYYTMDGGQELTIEGLYPVEVFPMGVPYMGSPFYYAHEDGRGDMSDESESGSQSTDSMDTEEVGDGDLAEEASESEENTEIVDMGDTENYKRTEGTFWLDADPESGYLKMDGEGGFWIYNASGELETEGYLIDEEDSDVRYKMYLSDGEYFDTLYCKGVMEMHFLESGAYYDRTPGLETDEAW